MRWAEIFVSILRRKGFKVEHLEKDEGKFSGDDEDILVEGKPIWNFIEELNVSKHELLRDNVMLVTRIFDDRLKSFIKNIVMGKGQEKVEVTHYSYRIEFQARGLPHAHGCLWLSKACLEDFGCQQELDKSPKDVVKLIDSIVCC